MLRAAAIAMSLVGIAAAAPEVFKHISAFFEFSTPLVDGRDEKVAAPETAENS